MKKTISGAKYPLTVKKSAIAGHGAFAVKTIPWGKKIVQFKGAIIGDSEAKERAAKGATAIMDWARVAVSTGSTKAMVRLGSIISVASRIASYCVRTMKSGSLPASRASKPVKNSHTTTEASTTRAKGGNENNLCGLYTTACR